jgi:hypothetical protein
MLKYMCWLVIIFLKSLFSVIIISNMSGSKIFSYNKKCHNLEFSTVVLRDLHTSLIITEFFEMCGANWHTGNLSTRIWKMPQILPG